MTVGVRVDASDPTPPYEQLRRQLAAAIDEGVLADGARLPTVRQLAADLGIAPGTVMRAYAELEASGRVATRRAAGTRVIGGLAPSDPGSELRDLAGRFVERARALGVRDDRIAEAVARALGTLGG